MIYTPVIVIPAYKRSHSLARLLTSVNEACYPHKDVHLVISVDGDASSNVKNIAKKFRFKSGTVQVIEQDENLGLYRHILQCADLSQKYGSVLILEDDLIVGPAFYEYACKTLAAYDEEESIAGISLYSQRFNETALLPFEPIESEWPVYFMQLGCSWGQAWTNKQWQKFKQWLAGNGSDDSLKKPEVPTNIQKWPQSSWKKFFNHYLIEQDKYMVYPYSSFSTNLSESPGMHMKNLDNCFQVPLNISNSTGYKFHLPEFNQNSVRYDAFMEINSPVIERWIGVSLEEVEVDLYGTKPVSLISQKKYTLTSKTGKHPIRSFPLSYKPIELNLKFEAAEAQPAFLNLYRTEDLNSNDNLNGQHYFRLVDYFSYTHIKSRRFAAIYFKEFIRSIINQITFKQIS